MKICIQQFLGKSHSWSIVGQNYARSFRNLGNEVHLQSTNGLEYFPDDLKSLLKEKLDDDYDLELSYTSMKNFPVYLNHSKKSIKFGIWCFEWAGKNAIPTGFAKHYKSCNKILPPSQFAKQVFLDSGVPESSLQVVPHGFDKTAYDNCEPLNINTKKSIKILLNIAQNHMRKNFAGALDAFGKAFSKKDDVCLVLKIVDKEPQQNFEVSFKKMFNVFKTKYPNHAEVKIITDFIPNIGSLYKSCDILYSLTHCEAFYMPGLEALSLGLVNVVSGYGGQLDFLNNDNSLLVSGKVSFSPPQALYWDQKAGTYWFEPSIDDAVEKLRYAANNILKLKNQIKLNNQVIEKYSWDNVANSVLDLYKQEKQLLGDKS